MVLWPQPYIQLNLRLGPSGKVIKFGGLPQTLLFGYHFIPAMRKIVLRALALLIILYVLICIGLYFFQEKLIFTSEKLDKAHQFSFDQSFEEINIKASDGNSINGLLFKADSSKGLIFYLHGNTGSLNGWGGVARRYTDLNYSVFILDYPGYGKSDGSIKSQTQLFHDIQIAYNEIKKRVREDSIIILGYSIGTGPASKLASTNHPKLLILQAPYYSLTDMMQHNCPILPTFLLKYKFQTNEYLKACKMPVIIFHGNQDGVVYYESSLKLEKEMKAGDTLITLDGQGHNGITDNPDYVNMIKTILK
jgi:pimeloyl-ACP methyl ester carboxylesterase